MCGLSLKINFFSEDFERLLLSFPTDFAQVLFLFLKRRKYDMIYETKNFMIDFHAIPFPRKGEEIHGVDSAREITIYNDTIFSVSHRRLMYFEEEWIAERFKFSQIYIIRTGHGQALKY